MDALHLFGEGLKKNRQEKQISLAQVSASTRINERFLEAIEAGELSVLPKPYIRSFIREYAVATELNPEETLRQYSAAVGALEPAPAKVEQLPETNSSFGLNQKQQAKFVSLLRRLSVPLGGIVVVVVAVLLLASSGSTTSQPTGPAEVSFDRAVQESEAALTKTQPVASKPVNEHPLAVTDSLSLEMTTTDSVWIVVVIDERRSEEYLFPPKYHRRWVARDQFSITMGNAGNATFRVNGKELGTLGKPGVVVRNAVITENTAPNL